MERLPGEFLRSVSIRNFKSIGKCSVELQRLTMLVGRNGSGKSNFLDAIRFVADGLQTSLDHAIKSRGGIDDVRRRSTGHPRNFAIQLEFMLSRLGLARYGFEIAARPSGAFAVKFEQLTIYDKQFQEVASYVREAGNVKASVNNVPPVLEDRLYLVNAAGLPEFRPAFDALLAMGFYNLNPEAMKELQSPDAGELLHHDGANIASVVARLNSQAPETMDRIRTYLAAIVPGISGVERVSLGPRETLQFGQKVEGSQYPWKFFASSMSDGTLRALGAIVAVTQLAAGARSINLVGIEEPETALHPAAAGALMDALREASNHTQIVVTTHSPDLLDQLDPGKEGLLVAISRDGNTGKAPADPASIDAIRQYLYTPGELLKMDQLQPDVSHLESQQQLDLFSPATVTE